MTASGAGSNETDDSGSGDVALAGLKEGGSWTLDCGPTSDGDGGRDCTRFNPDIAPAACCWDREWLW